MLGRLSRTAAAVMMVGLIAGAAVAFSLGVPIHSAATCNNQVTYGTSCPGNPLTPLTVSVAGTAMPALSTKPLQVVFAEAGSLAIRLFQLGSATTPAAAVGARVRLCPAPT